MPLGRERALTTLIYEDTQAVFRAGERNTGMSYLGRQQETDHNRGHAKNCALQTMGIRKIVLCCVLQERDIIRSGFEINLSADNMITLVS